MTEPTPHDLLTYLNDGLAEGCSAMVVLVEKNEAGRAIGLKLKALPMTAATLTDIAMFTLETAIDHRKLVIDGSDEAPRRHLVDALHSLQAAAGISDAPTIGRA